MRPTRFGCLPSSDFTHKVGDGTVFSYEGQVTSNELGYPYAYVALYNHANYTPLSIQYVDDTGKYIFNGLRSSTKYFVLAFDTNQQFNIVGQSTIQYTT